MSASVNPGIASSDSNEQAQPGSRIANKNYKGFVAGIFSGIAKLSGLYLDSHPDLSSLTQLKVGHPFDTIKVRLQTSEKSQFRGPLHCLGQTVKNEGIRGLYKGATPPCECVSRSVASHHPVPRGFGTRVGSVVWLADWLQYVVGWSWTRCNY